MGSEKLQFHLLCQTIDLNQEPVKSVQTAISGRGRLDRLLIGVWCRRM